MRTFQQLAHPFVWTTEDERSAVLANVNEPIWHRFLEEAEQHFAASGGVRVPQFPVFCHDGDLDEVMAACVLATVRNEPRLWGWVADWLRTALAYFVQAEPLWRANRFRILRGERVEGSVPNVRQHFEGFTRGGAYWVEAGFTSVVMHLLDQLEAYAPQALKPEEKAGLLNAVADYAERFAFHEERLKYNNRGTWGNAGVLLASLAKDDSRGGAFVRFLAERRNEEFRATFLDDGFNIEGAPDYHLMAADALLAYLLTASAITPERDLYAAGTGTGFFERYPSFVDVVRAYIKTIIPGPVLWNHSRGCSVSTAVTVRPALVQAWRLSRDPAIGWVLKQRMGGVSSSSNPTPLNVTNTALLGLGHYQPLLNFWLYRPVDEAAPPQQTYVQMPDFGSVFSRSGWGESASCVSARFGFEGSGKGHRDHAHVTVRAAGVDILKDPFPRHGPKGLDTAMFHNTVVVGESEPAATVGRVLAEVHTGPAQPHGSSVNARAGSAQAHGGSAKTHAIAADAFLIDNRGGHEPERGFLDDPCEEANYWFTNQVQEPDFTFRRAVIHVHDTCVAGVDRVDAGAQSPLDWFFHSDIQFEHYDAAAAAVSTSYACRQRMVVQPGGTLEMVFRGQPLQAAAGEWLSLPLAAKDGLQPLLRVMSPDSAIAASFGGHEHRGQENLGGGIYRGESDFYLRVRAEGSRADLVWVVSWGTEPQAIDVSQSSHGYGVSLPVANGELRAEVDFDNGRLLLT